MIWLYRRILDFGLARLIRRGGLHVTWPDGSQSENQIQACQDQSGRWYLTPPPQ